MLSIGRIRPGGADYYVGEIATSAEDYYLGHGEAPGRWVGSLAAEMGLEGEVDAEHFRALLEGRHPVTGDLLVEGRRTKAPYVSEAPAADWLSVKDAAAQLGVSERFVRRLLAGGDLPGEKARSETTNRIGWRVQRAEVNHYAESHKPAKARPGFDLTLRPPKSVSILWALAEPDQRTAIRQAHREAVDEVVRYYESQAIMARAKGERIQTAGLVAAAFDHRTSRAGDPLLHTHVVLANLTLTVADTWRALDGRLLFDHALSGGYLYQAHLRHLLTDRLGIAWGPITNGLADVVGVPETVIDEFSQRRNEIEELLAESGHTSARARQAATLATRNPKDRNVDAETLADAWRGRATALGFDDQAVDACFGRAQALRLEPAAVRRVFDQLAGPRGLTGQASTFTRRDVIRHLAAALGPTAGAENIQRLADRFLASDRVVVLAGATSGRNSQVVVGLDNRRVRTGGSVLFSTPELLDVEADLLRWAEGHDDRRCVTAALEAAIATRPELTDEQVEMVRAVCSSTESLLPVVGRPGSGKTYATAACVDALVTSGVPVSGCAVSATAADELEAAVGFRAHTGRPASTIASLLVDLDRSEGFAPGVALIVDEASMVGTRDLARLASHVDRASGRIVLIGDPDQHTSVDTGGAFRVVAARRGEDLVTLVGNNRQLDPIERQAIEAYRDGRISEALAHYDDEGKIVRQPTARETYDALVADWYEDRLAGSGAPMLAGTNAARRALNSRARARLKTQGVLLGDALVVGGREFMVGDEVVARRNDRSLYGADRSFVKNGSTGTVTEVDVNHRELVVAFQREGIVRVPQEYLAAGHVEHAYARTTYGVQGATLDRVRYHPSDSSRFEEGYVAITRATESTKLYVVEGELDQDDEAGLQAIDPGETGLDAITDALARRSDQQLATETDPIAAEAGRLANRSSLRELLRRRAELDGLLATQPPAVGQELAEAQEALRSLAERQARRAEVKPSWKSSRRREAARTLASLDASVEHVEKHLADLQVRQAAHDAFAVEHGGVLVERDLVTHAISARRLKLRLEAVAEPPAALVELLGPRPTRQRDRLRWDRAVEAVAVHLDEAASAMPERAKTLDDLLGPSPDDPLAHWSRRHVETAIQDVTAAQTVERYPGLSIGR